MSDKMQQSMLQKLLMRSQHKAKLWAALASLCMGTTLLLLSVMIWWNFNELLYGKNQKDSLGSTYVIIGKRVTEQNMGVKGATIFTPQDIADIKTAPEVQDIGIITSNHFPVYAMMGGQMAFATDMPLESVPDNFLDKMPNDWKWQPGDRRLPLIISSQFLDLYNYVFAPSQGLPQLSEGSVKSIALNMKVGRGDSTETYLAQVVGFSDRIGSVLAPQSFIEYGNRKFGTPALAEAPSQLILKTKDPSNTRFAEYLKQHDYSTNTQNLRWSRVRAIVEVVTSATGVLALMLMGIGSLVFILFIELTIARAQHSLALLQQIGYGPQFLSRFMARRFVPLVLATAVLSAFLAVAAQAITASKVASQGLTLPLLPGWPVWAALAAGTLVLLLLVTRSISKAIRQ